jgi:hypothetical protein
MDISVKPQEVGEFARQLSSWAQQMQSVRQNIVMRTQSLEQQWRDPQYRMFVEVAKNHATSLGAAVQQFEVMSKELAAMSRELERVQVDMRQRIQNMQR